MAVRQRAAVTKDPLETSQEQAHKSPSATTKKLRRQEAFPRSTSAALLLLLMFGGAIAGFAYHAMQRVPKPLSENAPPHRFSEGRAMQHVEVLAGEIGIRLVGSENYIKSASYILEELEKIASNAGDHLRVEIDEQHVSGSFWMNILTHNMAMEYENITNIVLRISGVNSNLDSKAVLMNAHFDTTAGSPGASDCAQCVGVALEIARLYAYSLEAPPAPLIFLFNGGEETFMMGAHGFLAAHKWRDTIGAVINVESTGPGGPDLVFQAAGRDLWPIRVYSEVAPYPRASVIGQDTFDAHVIPGDTDFRVFAQDFGSIPGVDVVSLLDSYAYHTTQDTPDRIRRGTVQAMGDNLYALMKGLCRAPELNKPTTDLPNPKAVFWDLLGYFQVYYPRSNALIFHLTPLAIVALVPLFSSDEASGLRGMPRRYNAIVSGVLQSALAWVLALVFAVGVAALRVAISGKPITWLARPSIGAAMYTPPALLGVLLVQLLRSQGVPLKDYSKQRALNFTGHWGSAVGFNAVLSAVLILRGIGGSYLGMFWAMTLLPGLHFATEAGGFQTLSGLTVYITIASVPLAQSFYLAFTLATFIAQKIGASGNWPDPVGSYVGDLVLAALIACQTALIAGPLMPILRHWLAHKRVMRFLVYLTLIGSIVGSTFFPYSPTALKRMAVQHTIWTQGKKDVIGREYSLLSFDPLSPTFIFDHSAAFRNHFEVSDLGKEAFQKPLPNTWLGLFPLSEMVHRDVSIPERLLEPPAATQRKPFPRLKVISNEPLENDRRRILVEINNGALGHAWRTINVTGPVVGWSLGNFQLPASEQRPGGPVMYIARHAGGPGTEKWRFWIEAEGTKKIRIDLAVLKFDMTPELEKIKSARPDWVDFIGLTSYISTWKI